MPRKASVKRRRRSDHRRRCVILLSLLLILTASLGWAAGSSTVSGDSFHSGPLGRDKLGQVGSRSLYYVNDQYQNPEARAVQLFEGRITREADKNDFSLGIDLEGQFSPQHQGFNSFTANEFYFRMDPLWSGTTLFLGRKRSSWSGLDAGWKLGLWEPVYRIDALNPHTQGLTGLFVNFKTSNWNLEIFGTPFFLPDHGPQMETRNGQFVREHPWVQYPPSEVYIKDVPTEARYQIDKPSIPDVIVNTGYGMNLQWGQPDHEGWSARAAWSSKPMNQLLLGFDGNLKLAEQDHLDIKIHPEVGFHRLASLDGFYRSENWAMSVGLIDEQPQAQAFDLPWTYQNFSPSQYAAAGFDFFTESFRWGVGYLQRSGGELLARGPRAGSAGGVLPERFLFRKLVKTEIVYNAPLRGRWSYELAGEWRREIDEGSEIFSGQSSLLMGPFWRVFMGFDLLQSENRIPNKADFIESYLMNDRVYGGLQYVF